MQAPSPLAITKVDFIAMLAALVTVLTGGLLLLDLLGVIGAESATPMLTRALRGAAIVGGIAAVYAWRIIRIRRTFGGNLVQGTITKFKRFKDRGYLHYSFVVDGAEVETWHFVHQTHAIERLAVGQPVQVVHRPSSPRTAFVVDAFQ